MKKILLLGLLLMLPLRAGAEVALLVHGYLSNSATWELSGVNAALRQAGWQYGGNYAFSPTGLVDRTLPAARHSKRTFYTLDVPSLAPLPIQAAWIEAALNRIAAEHPNEAVTLVGHSAGGVAARLTLVRHGTGPVKRLVTIAAPHLGTDRAVKALDAVDDDGFFGPIKEWIVKREIGKGLYRTLELSRGVLFDLVPPAPGTLLWWLNGQLHPDIEYVSVVRSAGYFIAGDLLVPPFSQDMNRVPALAGRSQVYITIQGHQLTPADGLLLARIL